MPKENMPVVACWLQLFPQGWSGLSKAETKILLMFKETLASVHGIEHNVTLLQITKHGEGTSRRLQIAGYR